MDEGISWETKGTKLPAHPQVRKAVNGLANQQGGFLLVGVRQGAPLGTWVLDGVDFDGDEPTRLLADVIAGGLDPVPAFDVKPFEVDDGKHVAVVMVEPVAVPPCVTIAGQIYERLPGKTEPVNATTLARLRGQGVDARTLAQDAADAALNRIVLLADEGPHLSLELGLAPTGRVADIGGRLFTETFEKELQGVYEDLPLGPLYGRGYRYPYETSMSGSRFRAVPADSKSIERWSISAGWDGSIGVFLDVGPIAGSEAESLLADSIFSVAVEPAVRAAEKAAKALGGFGPAHVVLRLSGGKFALGDGATRKKIPTAALVARTWTDPEGQLSLERLERLKRDILRMCGIPSYEPEAEVTV